MKKKISLPIIIISSVVAVILIAVIVLCCISIKPFKPVYDYSSVTIATSSNSNVVTISDKTDKAIKDEFDKGLKTSSFSVMHASLEFVFSYGPKFDYKKETNDKGKEVFSKDEDGNKIKNELKFSEVTAACAPSDTSYVLTFNFTQKRTMKVEKSEVEYDRVRVAISTMDGEVKDITIYPYLDELTYGEGNTLVDEYLITPVIMRANTTKFYKALNTVNDLAK